VALSDGVGVGGALAMVSTTVVPNLATDQPLGD